MSAAARTALTTLITLAIAAVAPTSHADTDAGYDSAEQAFEAVFIESGLALRAYDENREYAAALYQLPDGRWHSTEIVPGGPVDCAVPYHAVPPNAIRIAGAHTHGQPRLPEDPARIYGTDFSRTDRRNAISAYQVSRGKIDSQLLLTSRLEVLQMTISVSYEPESATLAPAARTARLGDWAARMEAMRHSTSARVVIEMQPASAGLPDTHESRSPVEPRDGRAPAGRFGARRSVPDPVAAG